MTELVSQLLNAARALAARTLRDTASAPALQPAEPSPLAGEDGRGPVWCGLTAWRPASGPVIRGDDYVALVALVEELIEAHHDTIALLGPSRCASSDEAHLDYLRCLTRAAYSTLARLPTVGP